MKPKNKLNRHNGTVKIDYQFTVNCREYMKQVKNSEYSTENGIVYNGAVYKDLWLNKLLA